MGDHGEPFCDDEEWLGDKVDLIILLDNSGSAAPFLSETKAFVLDILSQFVFGDFATRSGLIEFSQQARLLSPLSADVDVTRDNLNTIEPTTGLTCISCAFDMATEAKSKRTSTRASPRARLSKR